MQSYRLLQACCHQLANNLLRACDIRLVGTTCCESVGLINNLFQTVNTGKKQNILLTSREIFTRVHPSKSKSEISGKPTRVKTHKLLQVCKQVVTNLFTSCQQVVFALLVPSCCNKFGTTCSQPVTSLMALSDLLQGCSNNTQKSHIL
jgi:hypothetical protein